MDASDLAGPRWAASLHDLIQQMRFHPDCADQQGIRRKTWLVIAFSVARYLRYHAPRVGRFSQEDLEDIASQKSLELIHSLDTRKGSLSALAPDEIPGFLSTVARRGLIDCLRTGSRWERPVDEEDSAMEGQSDRLGITTDSPDTQVQRKEFALALGQCAEKLDARSRLIWFFRVFYDMPSKEIATHPEIRLKPSHVDVLLQRSRDALRRCMGERGFEPQDMPLGTFAELWKSFRLGVADPIPG
jgi:RNA polymerase sigma factor (sigma-70 family)